MAISEYLTDPRHIELVEWLCTPPSFREPKTQSALCQKFGIAVRTMTDWKNRDDVRKAWEAHSRTVVGDPSKVQEVLEEMRRLGLDSSSGKQVQAAKLYLEAVDAIKPQASTVEVKVSKKALEEFTDDELLAAIAAQWAASGHAAPPSLLADLSGDPAELSPDLTVA